MACDGALYFGLHDGFLYRGGDLSLATLAQWTVVIAADAAIRKGDMEVLG